jgi:ATP-dependent exoDNAse (exonuclease V) alpha subunit
MAIYHLSVKPVSRSSGRSATALAAYRAAERIEDRRTGETHDYARKGGVESADIVLPDNAPTWASDRAALWNAAELAEKRKDACVAREYEVALPSELPPEERRRLAVDFAKAMANREGCAVDVCIHAPGRGGDERNHHAHLLRTTRKVEADGLGAKLDTEKAGRNRKDDLESVRAKWAELVNERLRQHGVNERIDHRSLEAQGIDRAPTQHMGPAVSGLVRRSANSEVARRMGEEANARLFAAREVGRIERELDRSILYLSGDLAKAKADRDRNRPTREEMDRGISDARRAYAQHKAEQKLKAEQEAERANIQAQKVTPPARQETKEAKRNSRNVQMAESFAKEPPVEAVKKYPELAGAYVTVAALDKKAEADGLDEMQRAIVSAKVRELVANNIERGEIPNTKIREEKEVTKIRRKSNDQDYSR